MLDVEGARVAHLSYSFGFNGFTPEHEWQANLIEVERILDDARRARERGSDLTVVSLHWGVEPLTTPTAFQTQVADGSRDRASWMRSSATTRTSCSRSSA